MFGFIPPFVINVLEIERVNMARYVYIQQPISLGVHHPDRRKDRQWSTIGSWGQGLLPKKSQTDVNEEVGAKRRLPTSGFFFDLIQCIIQRDYSYFTDDVRDAYQSVREALLNDRYNKVVFIIHTQGGIEGGMVLDWLLANVATAKMHQLEVYTFGN